MKLLKWSFQMMFLGGVLILSLFILSLAGTANISNLQDSENEVIGSIDFSKHFGIRKEIATIEVSLNIYNTSLNATIKVNLTSSDGSGKEWVFNKTNCIEFNPLVNLLTNGQNDTVERVLSFGTARNIRSGPEFYLFQGNNDLLGYNITLIRMEVLEFTRISYSNEYDKVDLSILWQMIGFSMSNKKTSENTSIPGFSAIIGLIGIIFVAIKNRKSY